MMRTLVGISLLGFVAALSAASGTPAADSAVASSASGQGTMSFGADGHGAGVFQFNVARGGLPSGSLLFAGEEAHRFPDIVVRMDNIRNARFGVRSVQFSGRGTLHDQPVTVSVTAFDGAGTKDPDSFGIKCKNAEGKIVLEARGELTSGDVVVGTPS
ncbi:MAG: hypothetical protein ACE5E1_10570 [Phycisphaerae bacterium]